MWDGLAGTPALTWWRVRYEEAAQASAALALLVQAGATIALRLRHGHGLPALCAGLAKQWSAVLEHMAPDFGLRLDASEESRPLAGEFAPGNWVDLPAADADAHIVPPGGMLVNVGVQPKSNGRWGTWLTSITPRAAQSSDVPIVLPPAELGLSARPKLPYDVYCPDDAVWHLGAGGFAAPACLIGEEASARALLVALAETALGEDRPTVIIDGTSELARELREAATVRRLLASGRLVELNIARAGQRGFNPLAESSHGTEATLARWRWWLRGLGVYEDEIVKSAYASGVRTLPALARAWSGQAGTLLAAHALQALLQAGDVAAWLSGGFDVAGHLHAGGHLLVECPRAEGARLQALRGLLALAAEGEARMMSARVQWPREDDEMLARLDALCRVSAWEEVALRGQGKRLTAVLGRMSVETAKRAVAGLGDSGLGEFLVTLPNGVALARRGKQWLALGQSQ